MEDETVKKEIEKAAANVAIEGQDVSESEKELIYRIYNKYKDRVGSQAIDSLLYGLVNELNYERQEYNEDEQKSKNR